MILNLVSRCWNHIFSLQSCISMDQPQALSFIITQPVIRTILVPKDGLILSFCQNMDIKLLLLRLWERGCTYDPTARIVSLPAAAASIPKPCLSTDWFRHISCLRVLYSPPCTRPAGLSQETHFPWSTSPSPTQFRHCSGRDLHDTPMPNKLQNSVRDSWTCEV